MNLVEVILKEHSKRQTEKIVRYVAHQPDRFAELVKVYLNGPYRVTQRAAWPLSICVEKHPTLIKPHLKAIVTFCEKPGVHDAVKRNTMRLLQYVKIPKSLMGKVADLAFGYLSSPAEPIAVKVFAMTVLTHLAEEFPELKNELIPLIEKQMPYGSAGFRSRGMKLLKILKG